MASAILFTLRDGKKTSDFEITHSGQAVPEPVALFTYVYRLTRPIPKQQIGTFSTVTEARNAAQLYFQGH